MPSSSDTSHMLPESERTRSVDESARHASPDEHAGPAIARTDIRAAGNQAVQRAARSAGRLDRMPSGRPGDAFEQDADRAVERAVAAVTLPSAPGGTSATVPPPDSGGSGDPRDPARAAAHTSVRQQLDRALGTSSADVRIHADAAAAASARAEGAQAFTVGRDVYFGAGQYSPDTPTGIRLMAHELAHVAQQTGGGAATAAPSTRTSGPMVQRQAAGSGAASTQGGPGQPAPSANVTLIPPDQVSEPRANDLLVATFSGKMVALPAPGAFVLLHPPQQGTPIPEVPLFTAPTIGKESLIVVNVGGRTGFQLDAGGEPAVVFPGAIAAIQQALGITSVAKVAITHIHEDHVQSWTALIRSQQIRPENIYFPAAFAANPAALGSTFARAMQAANADPALQSLGFGPGARFQSIPTPTTGAFFRQTVREGDVTLDFYGLTREFQDLQAQRARGAAQPRADTASLLTRATYEPTGLRVLFLGDLRGSDLTLFRQALGDAAYGEMLQGVRIIEGFQHHMGALESQADRAGLADLIKTTYLRSGSLTVIAQSQQRYGRSSQFLNRSLIEGLNQLGVDVHVAMEPQAGQVGTVTASSEGAVTTAGGTIESRPGRADVRADVDRLIRLRRAEEVLARYGRFVKEEYRYTDDVRRDRADLEQALNDYVDTTLTNVQSGAAGRAQSALNNPAQQQQALSRVKSIRPVEAKLMPAYMQGIDELNRIGPYRETFEEELKLARTSGRLSDKGIEALWEFDPEEAARLVGSSNLPRGEQRRVTEQLPGQGVPAGPRAVAWFMLAVEVAEIAAPLVQQKRASDFADDVGKGLSDIMWWQSKGVFPTMQGVNDRWWPRDNEWTTSPARIQQLLNSEDLDYLALTGIADENWDAFTIWISTNIRNYVDWFSQIQHSNAIKHEGSNIEEFTWSYRKGHVESNWHGFNVTEEWQPSDRLTTILRAAARAMIAGTERDVAAIEKGPGSSFHEGPAVDVSYYHSRPAFAYKPQAIGKKKYKAGVDPRALYTISGHQQRVSGMPADSVFYVFPDAVATEPVPDGYVVVGGADYDTYMYIYASYNVTQSYVSGTRANLANYLEVMLAKSDDLEDAK